jgi:hypothetical protein
MIMRFGAPERIITDRGNNFIEGALKLYEKKLLINHSATTPYHARANGMVERVHREINHALRGVVNERQDRWDEFVPQITFAINSRKHATTGYSPFYLAHGVEPRLPIDPLPPSALMKPLTEEEEVEILARDLQETMEDLGYARGEAYHKSVALAKKQRGKTKKKNVRFQEPTREGLSSESEEPESCYRVGDLVMKREQQPAKLDARWVGPFIIAKLGYPGTYWIQDLDTATLSDTTISEEHLAPWGIGKLTIENTRGEGEDDVRS